MTWITDLAANAKDDDDRRDRREDAYNNQISGVWNSLVSRIRQDVEALNRESYLVTHRLGGEPLRFEELNNSSFKVTRIVIPSAYMTVSNRHRYFEIERSGRETVDSELWHKPIEKIQIEPDSSFQLYMTIPGTNAGALGFSDISQHLLGPMLSAVK